VGGFLVVSPGIFKSLCGSSDSFFVSSISVFNPGESVENSYHAENILLQAAAFESRLCDLQGWLKYSLDASLFHAQLAQVVENYSPCVVKRYRDIKLDGHGLNTHSFIVFFALIHVQILGDIASLILIGCRIHADSQRSLCLSVPKKDLWQRRSEWRNNLVVWS
jgi:hypothetical protein